jgi:hypothetical protein
MRALSAENADAIQPRLMATQDVNFGPPHRFQDSHGVVRRCGDDAGGVGRERGACQPRPHDQ